MEGDNCVSLEGKVGKVDYVLMDITDIFLTAQTTYIH